MESTVDSTVESFHYEFQAKEKNASATIFFQANF